MFTPLQVLALEFTDQSTRNAYVPLDLCERLKGEIGNWLSSLGDTNEDERQAKVEDHYVEAVMVVATYNMVSRFLLATDVAGLAGTEVPWPVERKEVGKLIYLPKFYRHRACIYSTSLQYLRSHLRNQLMKYTPLLS